MPLDRLFIERMPKLDLHDHIDGALTPDDIYELAQQNGERLPYIKTQTREAIRKFYKLPEGTAATREGFDRLLKMFEVALQVMQTPQGLQDAGYRFVRDRAQQNYVYVEGRFEPEYSTRQGLALNDVIDNILKGIKAAADEFGIIAKLILCAGREKSPEESLAIARAAREFAGEGVVGFDIACNEIAFPPERHLGAYRELLGAQVGRTVHAGELPAEYPDDIDPTDDEYDAQRKKNIRTAVYELFTQRLGHAVPLVTMDDEIIKTVISDLIGIEWCPLSNKIIGAIRGDIRQLGIKELLERGVPGTLCSDDSAILNTSLADVYWQTVQAYGLEEEHVRMLLHNGVKTAFCSNEEKLRLYEMFKARGMPLISDAALPRRRVARLSDV